MAAHDLYSPSGAHRWMACPGSAAFCANIPDQASEDAEIGTLAHKVAEQAILNRWGMTCEARTLSEITSDNDMIEHAAAFVDWLIATFGEYTGEGGFTSEHHVDLSSLLHRPGAGGTCDAFWVGSHHAIVVDYKYGRHPVEVEKNPQLLLYAAGIAKDQNMTDSARLDLAIYQPWCGGGKVWTTTVGEAYAFARLAANKISQAEMIARRFADEGVKALEGALIPGPEQCRFCRGAGTCPALASQAMAVVEVKPEQTPKEPLPVPTTPEQIARALPWLELIERWCDKVRAAAHQMIQDGGEVPGYKLVEGRAGPRKWTDDAEEKLNAMSINKSTLYVPKLISPTEAERRAKAKEIGPRQWAHIQALITRSEPKPCLVPAGDPRPALTFNIADDFIDEDAGDLF